MKERASIIAARARREALMTLTVEAIRTASPPVERVKVAAKLGCSKRMVDWFVKCLVREGRLVVEGSSANYRHIVPGVGETRWSFGQPPQPMRKDKVARKGDRQPESPPPNPLAMPPLRGSNWQPRTCRYVIGEVRRRAPSAFCERPVKEGSSYCDTHHAICRVTGSALNTERDTTPDYRIRRPAGRASKGDEA